jgi:hypothetical protein
MRIHIELQVLVTLMQFWMPFAVPQSGFIPRSAFEQSLPSRPPFFEIARYCSFPNTPRNDSLVALLVHCEIAEREMQAFDVIFMKIYWYLMALGPASGSGDLGPGLNRFQSPNYKEIYGLRQMRE